MKTKPGSKQIALEIIGALLLAAVAAAYAAALFFLTPDEVPGRYGLWSGQAASWVNPIRHLYVITAAAALYGLLTYVAAEAKRAALAKDEKAVPYIYLWLLFVKIYGTANVLVFITYSMLRIDSMPWRFLAYLPPAACALLLRYDYKNNKVPETEGEETDVEDAEGADIDETETGADEDALDRVSAGGLSV